MRKDEGLSQFQKKQNSKEGNTITANYQSIQIRKDMICLRFWIDTSAVKIKSISIILRNQLQEKRYDFEWTIRRRFGKSFVKAMLSLEKVEWEQFYWDIRGVAETLDGEYHFRIKNKSKLRRIWLLVFARQRYIRKGEYVVYPYITNSDDPAIQFRLRTPYDNRIFVLKEYIALLLFYFLRFYWLSKKIWLVYEKYSLTAQDNSYYFFKYCQENLPQKEKQRIYYVINKKASDYQYVQQYGKQVIDFLSMRHLVYLKAAQILISSDTKAHAYAWRSPETIYRAMLKKNRNVFLQHGVIYFKQCHRGLKKQGTNNCRLFIVSSEVEKKIVKKYFGYRENEIALTGLARWDVLKDVSDQNNKMILVVPTWRVWLEEVSEDEFVKSQYYQQYYALLNDKNLHRFLEEKKVNMIFYIHPKFRDYIQTFDTNCPRISIVAFGEQPLNVLIMKCHMMVTDYSSACWDVFYQGKPIVFYLFDLEMYNRVQGSYVDMKTKAFGDTAEDGEELLEYLKDYEINGFKEKEKYAIMRETLLPYRDTLNSKRIYQAIKRKFLER